MSAPILEESKTGNARTSAAKANTFHVILRIVLLIISPLSYLLAIICLGMFSFWLFSGASIVPSLPKLTQSFVMIFIGIFGIQSLYISLIIIRKKAVNVVKNNKVILSGIRSSTNVRHMPHVLLSSVILLSMTFFLYIYVTPEFAIYFLNLVKIVLSIFILIVGFSYIYQIFQVRRLILKGKQLHKK